MTDRAFDVVEGLTPLAQAKGCSMTQFALAWCVQQPGVTSPIIGPRTLAQLEDNLKALDITITSEDRQRIDELIPPGQMASPFYEANFGPHPFRW
jgi:aryl-alcohol dehydrogenase-like predicted oxidoreductase